MKLSEVPVSALKVGLKVRSYTGKSGQIISIDFSDTDESGSPFVLMHFEGQKGFATGYYHNLTGHIEVQDD